MRCVTCGGRTALEPACQAHCVEAPRHATATESATIEGVELLECLGQGGFGAVYRARAPHLAAGDVAVKVARADSLDAAARLVQEVRTLRLLGGAHAPRLLSDATSGAAVPHLVMDLLQGHTLAETLHRSRLDARAALAAGLALAQAVQTLHERGVVHGDLKPENVFFDETRERSAMLVDFGLARLVREPVERESTLQLGTAEYMAPEQASGRATIATATDVYALGVVLFELFTGRVPFFGGRADVIDAHRARRPPLPSSLAPVPSSVEAILLKCLAKDAADRFPDAGALRAALLDASTRLEAPREPAGVAAHRPPAARPARAERLGAVVALEPGAAERLGDAVLLCGGEIAVAQPGVVVAIFWGDGQRHPAAEAVVAVQSLHRSGHVRRAFVDAGTVVAVRRAAGGNAFAGAPIRRAHERLADLAEGELVLSRDAATGAGFVEPAASAPGKGDVAFEELARSRSARPSTAFGRGELVAEVCAEICAAHAASTPLLTTVVGEAGIGKSTMAQLLAQRLEDGSATVLFAAGRGSHAPDDAAAPRAMISTLLSRVCRLEQAVVQDRGEEALDASTTAALLRHALGTADAEAPELASFRAAPGAIRHQLARLLAGALRSIARTRPVVVVLDDAAEIDAVSLDALELATQAGVAVPIAVVVFAPSSFFEARAAWGARAARRSRLDIGPLSTADARALCEQLLLPAVGVPEKALDHLLARANGNPQLLTEIVHAMKASGAVRPRVGRAGWFLATEEIDRLPTQSTLSWLAERALDRLPAAVLAHAKATAVLGPAVRSAELAAFLRRLDAVGLGHEAPLDATAGVERLVDASILVRRADDTVAFRTALLHAAVAERIAPALRPVLHRAAYETLSADAPARTSGLRSALARHAEAAAMRDEALALYLEEAREQEVAHDYLRTERAWTHVLHLAAPGDAATRVRALRGRAVARYRLGRASDSTADFTEACLAAAESGDPPAYASALLEHATALDWGRDFDGSAACVTRAQEVLGSRDTPSMAMAVGRSAWRRGELDRATSVLEQVLDHAQRDETDDYETLIATELMLLSLYTSLSRLDDAERMRASALARATRHGDRLHMAATLGNSMGLFFALGRPFDAADALAVAIGIWRELGLVEHVCAFELALADTYLRAGAFAQARAHAERAREWAARHGAPSDKELELLFRGRAAVYEGAHWGARGYLDELRASLEERASRGDPSPFCAADEHLARMVELSLSDGAASAWDALQAAVARDGLRGDAAEVAYVRALTAERAGRLEAAEALYRAALEIAAREPNASGAWVERELQRLHAGRATQWSTASGDGGPAADRREHVA